MNYLIKLATTALLSKATEKLVVEVLLITLNRWATSTETTWDDEVVKALQDALKGQ